MSRITRRNRALIGILFVAALFITWAISRAQGGNLRYGETVNATLAPGVIDKWYFTGNAGDVIALLAERTSGELEPTLRLQDSEERPVAGSQGNGSSAALVDVRLPQSGSYTVLVSARTPLTAGSDYRLTLTLSASTAPTPTLQPTLPVGVSAGAISLGTPVQGELGNAVFRQLWRLAASSGTVVDIRMTSTSGNLDSALVILTPTGETLATNDSASDGPDAGIFAFTLPYTGDYTVVAGRSGPEGGRAGLTAGRYELSVTARGPANPALNTILNIGSPLRGRLTSDLPLAVYRLEVNGSLAFTLDLGSLRRLARLRVLSTTGTVLASAQGLSPLGMAARLPDRGPFYVEVGSTGFENTPIPADFAIAVYRLGATVRQANPLQYSQTRRSSVSVGGEAETWFFTGHKNDSILLTAVAEVAVPGIVVKLTGPSDTILFQGDVGSGLSQPFILPADGLYQAEVRPGPRVSTAYEVRVVQTGAGGNSFERFAVARDRGPLPRNSQVDETLTGSAENWWLDGSVGQLLNLILTPTTNNTALGLALRRPDGSILEARAATRVQGAVIQRARLDVPGRYRVVVFDLQSGTGGSEKPGYRLQQEDASGGLLAPGQPGKDVVAQASGNGIWSLEVTAGALVNVRLRNLSPAAWTPSMYLAEPGGSIIASSEAVRAAPTLELLGVRAPLTGTYWVVVGGPIFNTYAAYEILSDVQVPFPANGASTIQVSATRPPVDRFAPESTNTPLRASIADLISPSASADLARRGDLPPLPFGTTVHGEIQPGAQSQAWRITSVSNITIALRATSLSGQYAPNLTLLDRDGKVVAEQFHGDQATTTLIFRIGRGGQYTAVASLSAGGGRYLLSLETLNISDGRVQIQPGRPIRYGDTVAGEIFSIDQVDSYYFLAAANDVVSVDLARVSGSLAPGLQLLGPSRKLLAEETNAGKNAAVSLREVRLPEAGIYAVLPRHMDSSLGPAGRYSLTLTLAGGLRLRNRGGGILSSGQSVTGLLTLDDTDDTWLFEGRAGARITLSAAGLAAEPGTPPLAPLGVRLQDTAGATLALHDVTLAQSIARVENFVLPADGVYRVQIVGGGQQPGVYTLILRADRDTIVARPLHYSETVGGVFTPGRNLETWVFSGTMGDTVSVALRYVRGDRFVGSFQVRAENGVALATVADLGQEAGARADLLLPFSGSYSILVANPDPNFKGAGVYTLSLNLQDSKARSAGVVLRYGQRGQGDLYPDDPQDSWIFSAHAGDSVLISARARDSFVRPSLDLHTPAGAVLATALPTTVPNAPFEARIGANGSGYLIPADGMYVINVSGAEKTTGAYILGLDLASNNEAENRTLAYGDSRDGLIADDRPTEVYTFSGRRGDLITANLKREPGGRLVPVLEIQGDAGQTLARMDAIDGEAATLTNFRLPDTGTYRLIAARYLGALGRTSGRYTITLNGKAEDRPVRASINYGQMAIGRLGDATPLDRLAFTGKAGEVAGITATATSGDLDLTLTLENSAGERLAFNDDDDGLNAAIAGVLLPADDTYTVVIGRASQAGGAGSAGNYELSVNRLYQARSAAPTPSPNAALNYGQRAVGTLDATSTEARYVFSGDQGDEIRVQLLHQTDDAPPLAAIQDPAGAILVEGTFGRGLTSIERFRLPTNGLYNLVVRRPINTRQAFSPYELRLDLLTSPTGSASGGVIGNDGIAVGAFASGRSGQYWLFQGRANQGVSLSLLRLDGDILPSVILIGPNGRALSVLAIAERSLAASQGAVVLPSDGVYSLLVTPGGPARSGRYRLTLAAQPAAVSDAARLAPGQTVTGSLNTLQPQQRWTFNGRKGQTVTARLLVTGGDMTPRVELSAEGAGLLDEGGLERTSQGLVSAVLDSVLPESGEYTLLVRAADQTVPAGTYRLSLAVGTPADTISAQLVAARSLAYGQAVRGLARQGAMETWAFTGAPGDALAVSVQVNLATGEPAGVQYNGPAAPEIEIQNASGRILARAAPTLPAETTIQAVVLPENGRYVVALRAGATVGYTLIVHRLQNLLPTNPTAATTRPIVPGTPLSNSVTPSEPVNLWAFSADAGRIVQITGLRLSGDLRLDLALYGPSGYLASASADVTRSDAPVTLGPVRLPEKGSYLLVVTRWLGQAGRTAGGYRLTLSYPEGTAVPSGGYINGYGLPVTGTLASGHADDLWTFDAAAGDVIGVRAARLDGDLVPALQVTGPGGAELGSVQGEGGEVALRFAAPATGRYSLIVARAANSTSGGSYRLAVERQQSSFQASVAGAEGIAFGDKKSAELTKTAPIRAWVLFGKAGERLTGEATPAAGSTLDPYLALLAPDGKTLAADDNGGGGQIARLASILLPSDGFYVVVVTGSPLRAEQDSQRLGAFSLTLLRGRPGTTFQGSLAFSSPSAGTLSPEQPAQEWTFEVTPGSPLSVFASLSSSGAAFNAVLTLLAQTGQVLAASDPSRDGVASLEAALPGPGRYSVVVSAAAPGAQGEYHLRLERARAPSGGGLLAREVTAFGAISGEDFTDSWRFRAEAGEMLTFKLERLSGNLEAEVVLYDPAGNLVPLGRAEGQSFAARVPTGGVYTLLISRAGGAKGLTAGDYSLKVSTSGN